MNNSLSKFKSFLARLYSSVSMLATKTIIEMVKNDVEEAIRILAPNHLLFKLKGRVGNSIKIQAGNFIEETFNAKRTKDNKYYYYNSDKGRYDQLTSQDLGVLVKEKFCLTLMDKQFKEILSAIQGKEVPNNNIWNFTNCLYDASKRTVLDCDKEDIFTIKNIGLIDEKTEEIISLEYVENVDIEPNFNEDEITLVQKTIQEILIPKYDESDTDLYHDYLQRVGACLKKNNKYKTIPMYLNKEGDNGKSLLASLPRYIFNQHWVSIRPEQLKNDNFIVVTVLKDKNMIVFDEIEKKSLIDIFTAMKLFSSGNSSNTQRDFFSDKTSTMDQMGMFWITTNVTPEIDTSENAGLRRIDILIPPNQFVKDATSLKSNQYAKIDDLDEQIKEDKEGLSWFISAAIKAHEKRIAKNEDFKCKQTPEETLNLLLDEDLLSIFMLSNLKETGKINDTVTNKEILDAFKKYLSEDSYATFEEIKPTPQMIGNKVKKMFPNVEKANNSKDTYYKCLKLND